MSENTAKKKSLKDSLPMILAVLGYIIQVNVPRAVNGSPLLALLLKFLLCAPLIVYAWLPADKTPVPQKIFLSGAILLSAAASVFLRDQAFLLSQVCLSAVLLVLLLATPGESGPMNPRCLLLLLMLIGRKLNYTFLREGMPPFFLPALVLGVLIAVLLMLRMPMKNMVPSGKLIMAGFLALFCTLGALTAIQHLNYALDTDPPQEYAVEIEDKKKVTHSKSSDDYKFKITADGESIWVEVSSGVYNKYEIGDTYPIRRYAGAFGEAFFLAGSGNS